MSRTLGLGLAILLQMVVAFAPSGLVLCVHDDGRLFLESASTACCRVCPRAEEVPEAARGGSTAVALDRGGDEDDHCRDFTLDDPGVRTPPAKGASAEARGAGERIGPAPAPAASPVQPVLAAPGEGIRETGPPLPQAALAILRTIVLRC
jgi:hypothetical protein